MASVSVSNTFVDGNTITAAGHNTNNSDIVTYINNRNDGSATWDALRVTTASAVVGILNNSSGTSNILNCQDNGTNVLSVADGGATTVRATDGGTSVALTVNNGTSTGNILNIQDNGTTVIGVKDGGFLGVGISSPDTILHIKGTNPTITMHDSSDGTSRRCVGLDGSQSLVIYANLGQKILYYDRDNSTERMRLDTSNGNFGINGSTAFGSGSGVIGIANAASDPSTNPSGGGILYISSGALKYRGSSGTVTTVAAA